MHFILRCLLYSHLYIEYVYIRYAIYFSSLDVRIGSNSDVCAVNLIDHIGLGHAYSEMYYKGIRKFYKQPY
jgi:hypothetical protein